MNNLEIVNVVGTGELEEQVNLEQLYNATTAPVAQYDPVHHQGCYLRFSEDGPLITVYNSGKYIIRASSITEVHQQREYLLSHLGEIEVPKTVDEVGFDINNIVASTTVGREIEVETLAEDLKKGDTTVQNSVSRLEYRPNQSDCTINIFRSGTCVIMGGSTVEDVENAWKIFSEEFKELLQEAAQN